MFGHHPDTPAVIVCECGKATTRVPREDFSGSDFICANHGWVGTIRNGAHIK